MFPPNIFLRIYACPHNMGRAFAEFLIDLQVPVRGYLLTAMPKPGQVNEATFPIHNDDLYQSLLLRYPWQKDKWVVFLRVGHVTQIPVDCCEAFQPTTKE